MKKIGFIYTALDDAYTKEQIEAFNSYGIVERIIDEEEIYSFKEGDELVIYELRSLGKTTYKFALFLDVLKKKQIKLKIIKNEISSQTIEYAQLFSVISDLSTMERYVISERTTRGIKEANRSGRVGGRPKISKEKIKKIRHLYENESYTLQQIADECDISLGTAYKYIDTKR